ncbi:NodT family efflux transporter outer membrane factor (OMF) lipoprotein [Dyadobacter jejuensis]|uniref:NodT family efflux transporter outer membrane factor (OMF) lipoprotein n=1 Tax=Dyadobacter jejuensis TaxID=1082580 RepID=A0A316BA66_9BACT|nr:TolC family protein [Dyadobacter jejuensis]PWJ59437.1 NodT family efflux transporter outer membrane factor (OMF) lipoprotein [Dyadobacter jejuensis]
MTIKHKIAPYLLTVGLLGGLSGCKLTQPIQQKQAIETPEAFQGFSDSTGIAELKWDKVFKDKKLLALIDTALANNLDLKMAMQRIEMARTSVRMRKAAILPSVQAEVSGGARKFGDYTMDGVGNYDTNFSTNLDDDRLLPAPILPDYFVGLKSSWEVDIWGKLKNRRKGALYRLLATEKARQAITTGLVAEVAQLYYDLVFLDTELDIIRKNIILQETAVETITIQKEGGRANELGVRQFAAQLLNTKSLEVQFLQKINDTENRLNVLLGRFPEKIDRSTSLEQTIALNAEAGIPASMLSRRPDVQQSLFMLSSYYADQQAAQLALLPSLNITALLGFNAFKSNLLFSPGSLAYNALGGLTAPVINRIALKSELKRAEAQSQEALLAYNKVVLTSFQEVSTSLKRIQYTKRISDFKKQEVQVLQQAVATSQDLFLGGYATYLEIIMAQKSVIEAELTLAEVQKEQYFALIELYRSLGGGWE